MATEEVSSSDSLPSYRTSCEEYLELAIQETAKVSGEDDPPRPKKRKSDTGALNITQLRKNEPEEVDDDEPTEHEDEQDLEFMREASKEAKKSLDPNTKVGAILVDRDKNKILGVGHNRMPEGCEELPWDNDATQPLTSKYVYVFHAVKAAIKDAIEQQHKLRGATVYTTLFPAHTDAQWIVDLGMKELVYRDNKYKDTLFTKAARTLLKTKGVKIRKMAGAD